MDDELGRTGKAPVSRRNRHGFGESHEFGVTLVVGDVLVHHLRARSIGLRYGQSGRTKCEDDAPPWLFQPVPGRLWRGRQRRCPGRHGCGASPDRPVPALRTGRCSACRIDGLDVHDAGPVQSPGRSRRAGSAGRVPTPREARSAVRARGQRTGRLASSVRMRRRRTSTTASSRTERDCASPRARR